MVARHVTSLRTTHTYCRVYNPHNNPVWIRRITPIATIEYEPNEHILSPIAEYTSPDHITPPNRTTTTLDVLGIQITNGNLTIDERQQLTELLMRNSDIFATDLSQLSGCTLSKHTIHTKDAPLQQQHSYQHSPAARREIERQTADMLATL